MLTSRTRSGRTWIYPATIQRFAESFIPEPNSGCWIWIAAWRPDVGKKLRYRGCIRHDGKQQIASRVSWKLFRGAIPEGLCVLHRCDTPECVNPDHLFLGTNQDNIDDRVKKGRSAGNPSRGDKHWTRRFPEKIPRGFSNKRCKLSPEQIQEVRRKCCAGEQTGSLAAFYGVSVDTIRKCIDGERYGLNKLDSNQTSYSHLPRGEKHANSKLTDAQRARISKDNRSSTIVAKEYGISFSQVCRIRAQGKIAEMEAGHGR